MKIIYSKKTNEDFWVDYWTNVEDDPDKMTSPDDYPLFPICQHIQPHHQIAEIGCGLGRFYKHYFYAGYNIVGLEYDDRAVSRLQSEDSRFEIKQGNILALDLPSDSFDITTAFGTLGNLKNSEEVKTGLKELIRITRPGGIILASLNLDNLGAKILNLKNTFGTPKSKLKQHLLAYSKAEFLNLAHEFNIIPIQTCSFIHRLDFHRIPFLRWPHPRPLPKDLRDGEQGYRLNILGQALFFFAGLFPNTFQHATTYLFRKNNK